MKKKIRNVAGSKLGYCPFSELESRYSKLYCDTSAQGRTVGATIQPAMHHETAENRRDTAGSMRVVGARIARTATTWLCRRYDTARRCAEGDSSRDTKIVS